MTSREITSQFQAILGRAPTADETSYFTGATQGAGMKPYEVGLGLRGLPEYQTKMLGEQMGLLRGQLGASDTDILGKAQNALQGQFAQLGRAKSSGYVSAFADAAQNLAMQRQQQVAGYYGQGLGNIFGQSANLGAQFATKPTELREQESEREYQQNMAKYWYYQQQNDYNNYSNQMRRQQQAQGAFGLGGSLLGMGIGALAAAPTGGMSMGMGALWGGNIGGGLGRSAGGLF